MGTVASTSGVQDVDVSSVWGAASSSAVRADDLSLAYPKATEGADVKDTRVDLNTVAGRVDGIAGAWVETVQRFREPTARTANNTA